MTQAPVMVPPEATPAFLARHGWAGAEVVPLAGDASFRRYFRVHDGDRTAVLMDAPPDKEDSRPFLALTDHLRALGLAAPGIHGADLEAGLLLLEDLADDRLSLHLARQADAEAPLYSAAIDVLVALQDTDAPADLPFEAHPSGGIQPVAPYDRTVLLREVGLFVEWYLPRLTGQPTPIALVDSFIAAWDSAWAGVRADTAADPVLVLRDYHADNLMVLDRPGLQRLGLLDYQDALRGHRAYDLVSLLQDARRDVAPALEAAMIDRYLGATGVEPTGFRAAYEVLGAQRNTKILGIFTRLAQRDGKAHYLPLNARVWGYLERNLAHAALEPVRAWFDAHVPPAQRAAVWSAR
jgi:aminoglycoside/choline kinase family phosphotransferase